MRSGMMLVDAEQAACWRVCMVSTLGANSGISLDPRGVAPHYGGMSPALTLGTDASTVAGRIGQDFETLLSKWESHLKGRHCSKHSIQAMLGEVRRAVRMRGWKTPANITYAEVMAHLESFEWAASTYNRNLSVFRSLTRWLVSSELLDKDPLTAAQRADGAGGPGSRAATTDDARAIVRAAWLREQKDGRARRSARSLYWSLLFLTGARMSEPGRWRWSDLILDEDPAVVLWTPDNQKANRREEIPLCPEAAELLRVWRSATESHEVPPSPTHTGTHQHTPTYSDMVFPVSPHKRSWADDRARAGITRNDSRGRPMTAHSARKWFKTTLVGEGVHPDLVARLMRHSTGVGGRYYDPKPSELVEALACLPKIYPTQVFDNGAFTAIAVGNIPKSRTKAVDSGPEMPEGMGATTMNATPTTSRVKPSTPEGVHGCCKLDPEGVGGFVRDEWAPPAFADGARSGDYGRAHAGPNVEAERPASPLKPTRGSNSPEGYPAGSRPTPGSGFDSRPPHSTTSDALSDFLAASAARDAALARLMRKDK